MKNNEDRPNRKYVIVLEEEDGNRNIIINWILPRSMWTTFDKEKTVGELMERIKKNYEI